VVDIRRHGRKQLLLAVAIVLLLGAILPLIGIAWGLPYLYHPDEPTNLSRVHQMFLQRTLKPPRFGYPSLFFYLQLLVHSLHIGIGEVVGWFPSATALRMPSIETAGNGITRDASVVVVARSTTVVLNVGLVGVTMWLGWLLSRRHTAAVLAGLLVAVHPNLVHNARLATPDTLAALTATAAIAAAVAVARNPSTRNYLLAGGAVGLAAGSKYNVAVVAVAVVTAYALGGGRFGVDAPKLVLAGGAAFAVFLLTTPFAVLDFHKFWHDATFVIDRYDAPVRGPSSLEANVRWLWSSTGPVLLLLLGAWWVRPNRKLFLIPLVFAIAYVAVISAPVVHFERNLMPVLPALLAVAAVVASEAARRIATERNVSFPAVVVVIALLVAAWPAFFALRDSVKATHDPRTEARAWIETNVPPKSRIMVESYSPYVNPGRYRVVVVGSTLLSRQERVGLDLDAAIITSRGSNLQRAGTAMQAHARETRNALEHKACDIVSFNHGVDRIEILRFRCQAPAP
jgi:4-amino-4-deoxy-L-arabinose transferase-like glycosyltransferase